MVPIGDISVMPQAWPTWMPRSRNHLIIARGAAEPPMVTILEVAKVLAGPLDMLDHAEPDGRHAGAEWVTFSSRNRSHIRSGR